MGSGWGIAICREAKNEHVNLLTVGVGPHIIYLRKRDGFSLNDIAYLK